MVNQVPLSLLGKLVLFLCESGSHTFTVGPSLPISNGVPDLDIRYTTEIMSKPAPQFITDLDVSLEALGKEQKLPLKPFKQRSGFDIGFFPRGAILGAVTIVLPTLSLLAYSGYRTVLYFY